MPLLKSRILTRLIVIATTFSSVSFLFTVIASIEATTVIFVDNNAAGANDGSSWANAYTDLQDALTDASSGDQIWVGRGLYSPGSSRTDTFQLKDGVEIYGGFAGTEATLEERTLTSFSILHGDIDDDDSAGEGAYVFEASQINGDNNYHIVNGSGVSSSAVLDGFIIAGGNADGTLPNDNGGGIFISSGSPTLRNLELYGNTGGLGGAIYISDGSPILQDILISGSDGRFVGGGIYIANNSNPNLTNLRITKNESAFGGGIASFSSNLNLTNVTLYNNTASSDGGGLYSSNDTLNLVNITVVDNTATRDGGGLYNTLTNPTIVNSIFWDNEDVSGSGTYTANVSNNSGASPQISYSFIQNSFDDSDFSWVNDLGTDKGNNSDSDPKLISGSSGLFFGSPAVNAGNTLSYTNPITTAIFGRERVQFGTIDVGAFEYNRSCPAGPISYVDIDADEEIDGTSWIDAHDELTRALWEADICDSITEVWVAKGVYKPGDARTDSFKMIDDLAIYGGFVGTETVRTQRDWETNVTVLSGDILNTNTTDTNGIVVGGQSETNSYTIISAHNVTHTAVLDGFAITGGFADGPEVPAATIPNLYQVGSGIYAQNGSPLLKNLNFVQNGYGAVYLDNSHASFDGAIFDQNWGSNYGGLYAVDSQITISNTQFEQNISQEHGGGARFLESQVQLDSVTFNQNSAEEDGGGLYAFDSYVELSNSQLTSNEATNGSGGGLESNGDNLKISGSTFSNNSAAEKGGAVYKIYLEADITNTDFSNNRAKDGAALFLNAAIAQSSDNTFNVNNASEKGGAIFMSGGGGTHVIQNTTFSGNMSTQDGGAIYGESSGNGIIYFENILFESNSARNGGAIGLTNYTATMISGDLKGNSASHTGGAIEIESGSTLTLTNSVLKGNFAVSDGGAIYNYISELNLFNTTFSGNKSGGTNSGGAIYNEDASLLAINSIFWNNVDSTGASTLASLIDNNNSSATFKSTIVEGSNGSSNWNSSYGVDDGGNLDINPLFKTSVDTSLAPTAAGDLSLQAASPAIDAGNTLSYTNSVTQTIDLAGNTRIENGTIDIGAYEAPFYQVTIDLPDFGGGTVSGSGFNCTADCSADLIFDTVVALTATPAEGYLFVGWDGNCTGTELCVVTLSEDANITANFAAVTQTLTVSIAGTGSGIITSTPTGINCPSDCEETLDFGTEIALSASPAAGSEFVGWSGACSGTEACTVNLVEQLTVTATFNTLETNADTSIYLPVITR